jgi:hypothetical protein
LKKLTDSVRFQFYKPKTEKTEPNQTEKNRVKPEKIKPKRGKTEKTKSNRFESVFVLKNQTETGRFEPVLF